MLLKKLKDFLMLPHDFRIMERNMNAFLESDRAHFPSDGGLFYKIWDEFHCSFLLDMYCKKVAKILQPAYQEYRKNEKYREQEIDEFVDLDKYLTMTEEDVYNAGTDFFVPIGHKFIYKGERYYRGGTLLNIRLAYSGPQWHCIHSFYPDFPVTPDIFEFSELDESEKVGINYPFPPLPIEIVYRCSQEIAKQYLQNMHPEAELEAKPELAHATTNYKIRKCTN